jgi:hypothetical protein
MVPTVVNPAKKFVKVAVLLTYLHRVPVQVLAKTLAILTELVCAFTISFHANSGVAS